MLSSALPSLMKTEEIALHKSYPTANKKHCASEECAG